MIQKKLKKTDEFKRKMALRFLQLCGWDIEELTVEAWQCLRHIDYSIYTIPLIKEDYKNGVTVGMLAKRYRLTAKQVRRRLNTDTWVGAAAYRNKGQ